MTALNSINAYRNHIKGKVENSQNKMVLDYIRVAGPCSIRMLHKYIMEQGEYIELVSLRRSVKDITVDTYGYDDDEATTEEIVSMGWFLVILSIVVCLGMGGLLWTLYSIADWIFK